MKMTDVFNLRRFLDAQTPVYPDVLAELRGGRKRSHWMWFIFPQLAGLGHSAMARKFAIGSRAEAVAYLGHAELGARLRECTCLVLAVENRSISEIIGSPDDMKFRSSMTLFGEVAAGEGIFRRAIARYYPAGVDPQTLDILRRAG
jgi:uncharacterized protein (DUF1810 family)